MRRSTTLLVTALACVLTFAGCTPGRAPIDAADDTGNAASSASREPATPAPSAPPPQVEPLPPVLQRLAVRDEHPVPLTTRGVAGRIPATLPEELRALVASADPQDTTRLIDAARGARNEDEQAAAGLALLEHGQAAIARAWRALETGDSAAVAAAREVAAQCGIQIYLSGVPHPLRLRAIGLYALSGGDDAARRIDWIETGRQDAIFQPYLPELRERLAWRWE